MTLLENARNLRKNQTDAERLLWKHLRNRQLCDCKFRRQFVIDNYIIDFICLDVKLVIELDGSQHNQQADYDQLRTEILNRHGFIVLRFWNNDVLNNLEGVMEQIRLSVLAVEKREQ